MGDFAATIENIVVDNILSNSKILPQASRASNAVIMFSSGCFLGGILLLVFAFYLWILATLGLLIAVVSTGGLLLLLSASCSFALIYYRDKKIAQLRKEISEGIKIALQLVKDDVGDAVQNHPKTVIAAACLAGFIAGKRLL